MENVFHTTKANFGQGMRNCIVIRRKPSQMPPSIDLELMRLGCIGHMDGPNSRLTFEFFSVEGFEQGKKLLEHCFWKETPEDT